jgi:hypothetical protein
MVVILLSVNFRIAFPLRSAIMTEPTPFQDLTIDQRETVLDNLMARLDTSASIARHEGDPVWKILRLLSDQLQANQSEIAADFSELSNEVVRSAIGLLARFELGKHGTNYTLQ